MAFFRSEGWKRGLSIALFIAGNIPQLAPYRSLLDALASVLGVIGVTHAAIS